jgi:hypothetical protein
MEPDLCTTSCVHSLHSSSSCSGTVHARAEATGFPHTSSVIPAEFVYVMLTAFEVRRILEGELRSGDMFRC